MPATAEQRERVLRFHHAVSRWLKPAVGAVVPPSDVDGVQERAARRFEEMLDELPYADRPGHVMFASMFACAAMLAVFRVVREHGVDAHTWGRACHTLPPGVEPSDEASERRSRRDADASQQEAAPNEFVFEMIDVEGEGARGMNITSCAICHLFGRYDAMELVPYMCSFDDVVSDAGKQGLRRTGTIALGATHCDFRFRDGGEPLRLAAQYPDRIRLEPESVD
ncbi:MAG: L-2-amino-thiazoline-4-carboxylic acid hydrolase [Myxococcota bacterium]